VELVFGHAVGAGVKVLLQGVHLSAEDVPEGLHLSQLLPQAVALLGGNRLNRGGRENERTREGEELTRQDKQVDAVSEARRRRIYTLVPPRGVPRTLKEEAEVRLEEDILKGVALRPSVSSVGRGRKHLRKQQHDNKVYIQSELNYLKRSTF
jgi:methyl coenzyme M reductase subunit C-like uncharacterized protein (methanogenesis marker protein 7)